MRVRVSGSGGPLVCLVTILLHFFLASSLVSAQQDSTCSVGRPCAQGCCSKGGQCGFTDAHCKDGCTSNCDAKAECGQWAKPENRDCPINTCCSEHGYCGTTAKFCGSGCQPNSKGGGCGSPTRPQCSINTDALTYKRRIAYYELFTRTKDCNKKEPGELPLGPLTHVNLAFVNFDKDFKLVDDNGEWVSKIVVRKFKYPDLRVNIAVGGWTFNDPPTATYWSDMASTRENRAVFIKSVVDYLLSYGLDGVDLDWEYPVASDRGGAKDDGDNYVALVKELREAFDAENPAWEITVTLPASYWYLRHFKLTEMNKYVSWWNVMTYDMHGMWDHDNEWTGPWLRGHTEWPEIDEGLDLLWRNGIKPSDVVMGFAFYGRSFTMTDPNCHEPNRVCQFTTGGLPGDCSDTMGILTYQEIAARNKSLDVHTFYNQTTTVKYNVYGGSQWISYDDAQSFQDKLGHLSERCLSGLMIWAIDQDTSQWDAMSGLFGDYSSTELSGLGKVSAEKLHDLFGQFNGQDCMVTEECISSDASDEERRKKGCPAGYASVETAHAPLQRPDHKLVDGICKEGSYRHICCPTRAMPRKCAWSDSCNIGKCEPGSGQFVLNTDPYRDREGTSTCMKGVRTLCCDGNPLFDGCMWTECDGIPRDLDVNGPPPCPDGLEYVANRLDLPDGRRWCSNAYRRSDGGFGAELHYRFQSSFCCPKKSGLVAKKCHWSNQASDDTNDPFTSDKACTPTRCPRSEIEVANALDPPPSTGMTIPSRQGQMGQCDATEPAPGVDARFPLCCSPPDEYTDEWPVDPAKLWKEYWNDPDESSVAWKYTNNHDNNKFDFEENADPEEINGDDAYGFVMLDGPKGAIDSKFGSTHTVVRRSKVIPKVKRELVTTNHTLIDQVFEHSEEVLHVYCHFPAGSSECGEVFEGGAEDTIISLPNHVGEGPFARIVYMRPAAAEFRLPAHHTEHRLVKRLQENPVYELKIDYNFHSIEARDDSKPVNIRIDYTNLIGYWEDLTDSPPSRIKKRGAQDEGGMTMEDFRVRVKRGVERDEQSGKQKLKRDLRTAQLEKSPRTRTTLFERSGAEDLSEDERRRCAAAAAAAADSMSTGKQHNKRWFGRFLEWLEELTTVREGNKGELPLDWSDKLNLFEAQWGCPGATFNANLRMDLEAAASMGASYAYYLSARFIPPSKPDVFFYYGMEPSMYLALVLKGTAIMQTPANSERKLIDTIGYPGLAVKGIAAVGPTLDLYGDLRGKITIKGIAKAGARIAFKKAEVYWPQDDQAATKYEKLLGLELDKDWAGTPINVEPSFDAGVQLDAQLDIVVRPEANVGVKVGGGALVAGRTLVDAQITAFMQTVLSFQASGNADITGGKYSYRYGVYLLYNLGYKAKATVLEWANWAMAPRTAYPKEQSITIFEKTGSIDLNNNDPTVEKRWVTLREDGNHTVEDIPAWHVVLNEMQSPNPANVLGRRQATGGPSTGGGVNGPNSSKMSANLGCPPGAGPVVKMPELRLNCGTMPKRAYGNLGWVSQSFCDNYFQSMAENGNVQTHDPNEARSNTRRSLQCPSGFCASLSKAARAATGIASLTLDCDEFPPASSEEGGHYYGLRGRTCVPSVQNQQHGQCVKMMTSMSTNVGKMEKSVAFSQRQDGWVTWSDAWWSTDGAQLGSATQRMASYDRDMPVPAGFTPNTWPGSHPRTESWMFKRNYTFNAVNDVGMPGTSGGTSFFFWDATNFRFASGRGTAPYPDLWDNVVCAVNIFQQTDYFKEPKDGGGPTWNGYCLVNPLTTKNGWPQSYGMSKCYIDFGIGVVDKRSVNGTEAEGNPWAIKGITILDDEVVPVDGAWDVPDKSGAVPGILEGPSGSVDGDYDELEIPTNRGVGDAFAALGAGSV